MLSNTEVIRQIVYLAETCREAIQHISLKTQEGYLENTTGLFSDFLDGLYTIEKFMESILPEMLPNQYTHLKQQLYKSLEVMVLAYQQQDSAKAVEVMTSTLLPAFKAWQAELDSMLLPYIAC